MDSIGGTAIKMSKKSNYENQDIISNLPDILIGLILSFLPIKDALRTCVLSTKWKYLWTFIPRLHFEDRKPFRRNKISKTHFLNFVYRVLVHLNSSSILSFSLSLSENYDPYHVNQWISSILNREVKELSIDSTKNLCISSLSLLKSQSLEKLVLNMNGGCAMRVPTFVSLSSLTVLKLKGITFTCDPSNDSKNLSLNFPVLREYETMNCTWLNVKSVTLEVPLLEVLLIKHTQVSISRESHTIIKFCAPLLTEFSYSGYMLTDIILLDLDLSAARIASANICLWLPGEGSEEKTTLLACELLKQLNNNVECLKIERSRVLALALDDLHTFGLLSRLVLEDVTGEILLIFLRNTPFLKTLILQELCRFDEVLSNPENVPSCFISNLEELKFGKLNGVEDELRFAKFVMDYAQVLKRASFSPNWNLRKSILEKVKKKILSFKRSDSFAIAFIEFRSFQDAIS